MRKFYSILILLTSLLGGVFLVGSNYVSAKTCYFNWTDSSCTNSETPYCAAGDTSCTLAGGLTATQNALDGTITNKSISVFVIDIVKYLLGFVTLVAVIYVIYAGFQVMTGAGDEEKSKKAKNIILYVIVGIVIMWLAYAAVNWIVTTVTRTAHIDSGSRYSWSLIPEASAAVYTESESDTFREYQNRLRVSIEELESEYRINKSVSPTSVQNIKNLIQGAYDRLPDFGEAGSENDSMKRSVDLSLELAIKNPKSSTYVSDAISRVASFISSAKIEEISGSITASPGEGNAPVTVSFQATNIKDPSGATPEQMNYIWWMRENGGVRRELGRGKSLVYTFTQEGTYTVFLDVISGSRNSKKKIDVLPLTTSTTIDVKPRLGEIALLINGVNVSNLDTLKINPTIGKMGIIFDATASRATGGNIVETTWDFGNNNSITYDGSPIIERQIFANNGTYVTKLSLKANNGQVFTKTIRLIVRDPSAVIQADKTTGNVGEDMYFSSISYFTNSANVEYSWQVQDDANKKVMSNLPGNTLRYKFEKVGNYIVTLTARSPNGEVDVDSRQITIESRSPVVNLDAPKPIGTDTPNIFVFDASKSYDPDTSGRAGLTYIWRIDGVKVDLDNLTNNGGKGTFEFDAIGPHTVSLTVANSYGKVTTSEQSFSVTSLLAANILITPRVAPIGTIVNFIAQSENADFFEWNMGDGTPVKSGNTRIVQHIYKKTGVYDVALTVSSARGTEKNTIKRRVYVTDTNTPFALIGTSNSSSTAYYDSTACGGSGATIVNRSEATALDATKSINIDGSTSDLTYTWNYFGKVKTTPTLSEKFNEIGCYPIKLTVRSGKNGATHTSTEYLSIKNLPPELTSISTSIDTTKKDSQKVLVAVSANGASDPDGVITSYIWYYTTESDKEPQNIQITQKPEITFVLPNITEKYYFGVILEDNDGAKTNSMDTRSEQVPLILDNQNGNIYMPLITLSMPKSAVLVGESVFMSAEAKTIVGTNITKNAEYAWDFDGDGRFDERSANPSVNYVFKNSGTYQIKVRVTYNGVSNTKYATVYVKNPLKASAVGYELSDGSIYFMNTSEGLYDTTTWSAGGIETQSPYTFTIGRDQLLAITGTTLGTLKVSHGDSDTSSYTLDRSNVGAINTNSGIAYQTSPIATDNTIHIQGQSDKLILSLIGNSATTYKIDSDTRIDSDLDGIPDNDIDNKNQNSYTDGSIFVISDFADSRVRERTIRITLESGGVTVGTQDITLILDFVTASQSIGDDDLLMTISGSMSSFDRAKLEELAAMIRSTESTDRIILMQEYNTMIENWGDSFSKAKSLIDIQEIVDTTTLTEDKKSAITRIVDELLVGDATSIDEVTLATKLIKDLIPNASTNKEVILGKLDEISSHPSDIESNKILGKEILELIKDDPTIEDKYKIHIKNQLLIIINGGQASVPSEDVEESSSGGSIMGFISGVVWVFLWILGGIIVVILLGYFIYLLGRKNSDIGFQDFLIDSVFHSKRPEKLNDDTYTADTSSVIINTDTVVQKQEPAVDPLANYAPSTITTETTETHENTEGVSSDTPVEPTSIPSWLQVPKDDPLAPSSSDANTSNEIDTPLSESDTTEYGAYSNEQSSDRVIPDTTEGADVSTDTVSVSPDTIADAPVPSWLQNIETDIISTDSTKTTELSEAPAEEDTSEIIEENPIVENKEGEQEILPESSDALPDWLVESLRSSEGADETEESANKTDAAPVPKKSKKKPTPKKEATEEAPIPGDSVQGDIPDWLK